MAVGTQLTSEPVGLLSSTACGLSSSCHSFFSFFSYFFSKFVLLVLLCSCSKILKSSSDELLSVEN